MRQRLPASLFKCHVQPGRWRIEVRTETGRLLGRIPFELVPAERPPLLHIRRYE